MKPQLAKLPLRTSGYQQVHVGSKCRRQSKTKWLYTLTKSRFQLTVSQRKAAKIAVTCPSFLDPVKEAMQLNFVPAVNDVCCSGYTWRECAAVI